MIIFKKENGITTAESYSGTTRTGIPGNKEEHLCGDCENARPDRCLKVAHRNKQNIGNYSDIQNGYQIVDEKTNELKKFIVTDCTAFEKDKPKNHTQEEKKRLIGLKKDLMAGYFDAENFEEAVQLQDELLDRGAIVFPVKTTVK